MMSSMKAMREGAAGVANSDVHTTVMRLHSQVNSSTQTVEEQDLLLAPSA